MRIAPAAQLWAMISAPCPLNTQLLPERGLRRRVVGVARLAEARGRRADEDEALPAALQERARGPAGAEHVGLDDFVGAILAAFVQRHGLALALRGVGDADVEGADLRGHRPHLP